MSQLNRRPTNALKQRITIASPITRLSPAFEKRQESAQRIAQIEQHPAAEQLGRAVCEIRAAKRRIVDSALFAQMAARAGDGEPFVVQQPLDAEDHVDVLLAINTAARLVFRRLQHGKLGFPVAQDKRDRKSTRLNSSHGSI